MAQGTLVTLERNVRLFEETGPRSGMLAKTEFALAKGDQVELGEPRMMVFDHRDQQAAQVLGAEREVYVILLELTEKSPVLISIAGQDG